MWSFFFLLNTYLRRKTIFYSKYLLWFENKAESTKSASKHDFFFSFLIGIQKERLHVASDGIWFGAFNETIYNYMMCENSAWVNMQTLDSDRKRRSGETFLFLLKTKEKKCASQLFSINLHSTSNSYFFFLTYISWNRVYLNKYFLLSFLLGTSFMWILCGFFFVVSLWY